MVPEASPGGHADATGRGREEGAGPAGHHGAAACGRGTRGREGPRAAAGYLVSGIPTAGVFCLSGSK